MKVLNNTELTSFCSQLALILRAGISSLEGLSLMQEDVPEGEGRRILEEVLHGMEATGSLHQALEDADVFPPYLCSMVEIGEQSGRLDDVMEALAAHYRREDIFSRNVRSAVIYPLVMLGMMIAVMGVLLVKVMPVFRQVYDQLGVQMSGFPRAVLDLGAALGNYSVVVLVLAAAVGAACVYLFFTEGGRKKAGELSSRLWFTRRLSRRSACSRFAGGMYLALSSGLNVEQGLEMTERLVEHPEIREKIREIRLGTSQGEPFADAVNRTGLFTGVHARMLSIGCRTGSPDDVLRQISRQYDDEIEEQIDAILGRLEPTLVAVLSVAVGLILLSVMLPLLGIMINIGG